MRFVILSLLSVVLITSCNKEKCAIPHYSVDQTQLALDIHRLDSVLQDSGLVYDIHDTGLRYSIINSGDEFGDVADFCDDILIKYKGTLEDGTEFDSRENFVRFPLENLIKGWVIGVPLIREGGEINLYVPSVYAYGADSTRSNIPPNSNLFFNIKLGMVVGSTTNR